MSLAGGPSGLQGRLEVAAAAAVATLRVAVRRWKQESAEPLGTILAAAFDTLKGTV